MARDVITVKPTDNLDCYGIDEYKESDIYQFLKTTWFWVISIGDVVNLSVKQFSIWILILAEKIIINRNST
jgi:hypothetical protein